MTTIYKYRLLVSDGPFPFAFPVGARLLHAEMSPDGDHIIEMWALVDPAGPAEQRAFIVRGTGHPVPDDAMHVATIRDGVFVWHLLEVPAEAIQ